MTWDRRVSIKCIWLNRWMNTWMDKWTDEGTRMRIPEDFLTTLYNSQSVSSVTQLCPTLCDPMNCSTPGLPVHHQLPESTQTHVHWVGDAIQPSHPLLSTPPGFSWQVAKECMVTPCSLVSNDLSLFSLQLGRKGWTHIASTASFQHHVSSLMSSYPLCRKAQLQA